MFNGVLCLILSGLILFRHVSSQVFIKVLTNVGSSKAQQRSLRLFLLFASAHNGLNRIVVATKLAIFSRIGRLKLLRNGDCSFWAFLLFGALLLHLLLEQGKHLILLDSVRKVLRWAVAPVSFSHEPIWCHRCKPVCMLLLLLELEDLALFLHRVQV